MMTQEMEAVVIYKALIADGYTVGMADNTWVIREPNGVYLPQVGCAIRTMREALKWAEGCESVRRSRTSQGREGDING